MTMEYPLVIDARADVIARRRSIARREQQLGLRKVDTRPE